MLASPRVPDMRTYMRTDLRTDLRGAAQHSDMRQPQARGASLPPEQGPVEFVAMESGALNQSALKQVRSFTTRKVQNKKRRAGQVFTMRSQQRGVLAEIRPAEIDLWRSEQAWQHLLRSPTGSVHTTTAA